ncbi:MAG: hydroxyacylglutathione hydrolase [Planctomycetota bacterium]|jgi:hydroxyacylglutathione hydrolase
MTEPQILNAFGDNYIYLLAYAEGKALVVDPGDAAVVTDALSGAGLELTHILCTHHHADHIGGIAALQHQFGSEVVSSDKNRIRPTGTVVLDGDSLRIGSLTVQVIATPGHTSTGVCYYLTESKLSAGLLFTGDTLFVCGCGRLFECTAADLFASFEKLRSLPDQTLVYPGHNYTEENIRFALTLESDNASLRQKLGTVRDLDNKNTPTVPSTLAEEKQLNPFLRAKTSDELAVLRHKKDIFG